MEVGIPTVGIASTHDPEELRGAGATLVIGDFADPTLMDLLDDPHGFARQIAQATDSPGANRGKVAGVGGVVSRKRLDPPPPQAEERSREARPGAEQNGGVG